jgi:hypothetical protein
MPLSLTSRRKLLALQELEHVEQITSGIARWTHSDTPLFQEFRKHWTCQSDICYTETLKVRSEY